MHTAEILRWTIVSGLAAALLRWPRSSTQFWSLQAGRPFVLARSTVERDRFRQAAGCESRGIRYLPELTA